MDLLFLFLSLSLHTGSSWSPFNSLFYSAMVIVMSMLKEVMQFVEICYSCCLNHFRFGILVACETEFAALVSFGECDFT